MGFRPRSSTIGAATPLFLFDKKSLIKNLENYSRRGFQLHYSVKACSSPPVLEEVAPIVDGFSVPSVADLESVRKVSDRVVHFYSPMVRDLEVDAVNDHGNSISFNSLGSFARFSCRLRSDMKVFVRINPEKSFLDDERYDPCRRTSKLGVPLADFKKYLEENRGSDGIDGIHFHNNCQSDEPGHIIETMDHVERCFGGLLSRFEEVNIGGGYVFSDALLSSVNEMSQNWGAKYGTRIVMEPGFDIVNSAGFLIASVVDVFHVRGKQIAVLDAAVNHLPEVFEYKDPPKVMGHHGSNAHTCVLAGSTCLAGDVFGEYRFDKLKEVGDVVVFEDVGAYSHVKANAFNGVPIPDVCVGAVENVDREEWRCGTGLDVAKGSHP